MDTNYDKLEQVDISSEMRTSFLDYSMSVIVQRALPDVRDGLKPVHRRILHSMNTLGITANVAHKKSARIVGEVIGKYHPHGDTAVYDAMVRMAQDFSYRYPLVDGHGNFGSMDGDGAAAMRYTEARMSKIAMELMKDIQKDTVDFRDNYDGEEKEPVVLPARFPNLLVNGSVGIAVGMATNIPPHNLCEAIDATLAIMDDPMITVTDLMDNYIKGPDFPTGGMILGRSGIRQAYETGRGSIQIRSKVRIEEMDNSKKRIVVYEIPYQVNKATLIEKIASLVREKIIDGMMKMKDSYNVPMLTQKLALASLWDRNYFDTCVAKVKATREALTIALRGLGFKVIDSDTNFVFAAPPIDAKNYFLDLKRRNILVRYFPAARTCAYVRITIGTPEEMTELLNVTKELIGKQ